MSESRIRQELPDDMKDKCYIWSGLHCIEQCELLGFRCDTATCAERVAQLEESPVIEYPVS